MGGWIGVSITAVGAIILFWSGHSTLAGIAVGIAIVNLWSYGVMHNYAYAPVLRHHRALEQLRKAGMEQSELETLERLTPHLDPSLAPNWITAVNLIAAVVGVGLCVYGFISFFG